MRPYAITLLLCLTGAAFAAEPAVRQKEAVAFVAGKSITSEELQAAIGGRLEKLRADEYRIQREALDGLVADALLEHEAKQRQITVAELLAQEVEAKVPPTADDLVEQALLRARGPIQQLPKEQAKQQIAKGMREIKLRERRQEFVASLGKEAGVVLKLQPPRLAIDASAPNSVGRENAPVTIVVFTDYQCPYCARAHKLLGDAGQRYGKDTVRIVYRHFPLDNIHPNAQLAAQAASCAGAQGEFWEMSERLFANQRALDAASINSYATELKLDEPKFRQCLDSQPILASIDTDRKLAAKYGLQGTPTIFINGRWMVEPSFENITRTIDDELAMAGIEKPKPLPDITPTLLDGVPSVGSVK
jgi:protein-disulfide isomerase